MLQILMSILSVVGAADTFDATAHADYSDQVLDQLRQEKFVRNLDCGVFANQILQRVGLPPLGQDEPLYGKRGDFDRTHQLASPPIFDDGLRRSEKPSLEYRVKASGFPSRKDAWYLDLTRNAGTILKTEFVFRIQSANNRPSCELIQIVFQEPGGKLSGTYDSERCLALFDPTQVPSNASELALAAIEQDCATGLHYFLTMKWPR